MFFSSKPQSLYIHIPFCSKKCSYCDFFSLSSQDDETIRKILDCTIDQINCYSQIYLSDKPLTVYVGGGTPSFLKPNILYDFLQKITVITGENHLEFSIEVNPESFTKDTVSAIRDSPVNRVSIGIQSFSEDMIAVLGRNCNPAHVYRSVELAKSLDDITLSFDIISSIPGQSVTEALEDAEKAVSFSPDHISLYHLSIEEKTPMAIRYSSSDQDENCWIEASDYLAANNYDHYEISNFASNGKRCIHNMNYWRMKPYLGCGMTAVSTVIEGNDVKRITGTDEIGKYLTGSKNNWGTGVEIIDKKELLTEILMMGFRTDEGVDMEELENCFSPQLENILAPVFEKWSDSGFLERSGKHVCLNRAGRFFHNTFMIDIITRLDKLKLNLT